MVVSPTVVVKTELPEVTTETMAEVVMADEAPEAPEAPVAPPAPPAVAGVLVSTIVVAGVGKAPVTSVAATPTPAEAQAATP
jgi:hypothetical protein